MMHNPTDYPSEAAAKRAFGARFSIALEALDIKPSQAAIMLGVSQPRLMHWVKGRHWPDCYKLGLFCRLTGVTLDYLVLGNIGALPGNVRDMLRKTEATKPEPASAA